MRAEHAALAVGVKALHRRDWPLERLDDIAHRDLGSRARETVAAVGAANRRHEAGLAELRDQVFEVREGQQFSLCDRGQSYRSAVRGHIGTPTELDHEPNSVLRLSREQHRT
jgi:hypothetical protein